MWCDPFREEKSWGNEFRYPWTHKQFTNVRRSLTCSSLSISTFEYKYKTIFLAHLHSRHSMSRIKSVIEYKKFINLILNINSGFFSRKYHPTKAFQWSLILLCVVKGDSHFFSSFFSKDIKFLINAINALFRSFERNHYEHCQWFIEWKSYKREDKL